MKLLYATTNKAKFDTMREALNGSEIELCGFNDFPSVGGASETGETALENAVIKAKYYFDRLKVPLFSCDTALEIENLPKSLRPGVNVRRVGGKWLTDAEMTEYYGNLSKRYGPLKCRYRNAICLIVSESEIYAADSDAFASSRFLMYDKPIKANKTIREGFPLDCLSEDCCTSMKAFADFLIKTFVRKYIY